MKKIGFKKNERAVFASVANNESLPFNDSTFDCYLASLSLMLVDNYKNQLQEAFRVTQPGASLGFTVWGRKQNCNNITFLNKIFAKHGLLPPEPPKKTFFDVGQDPEALRKEMKELGFKNIRMWYQAMNFNIKNGDEYLESLMNSPPMKVGMDNVKSPEQAQRVMADIKDEFNKIIGPEVLDPKLFEVLVITANKI